MSELKRPSTMQLDGTWAGAVFTPCERYRLLLWRLWDARLPTLLFVMLNPSKATHEVIDPTVRGCLTRAHKWGFGELAVLNLFAYRATDPRELATVDDPIGPGNDDVIRDELSRVAILGGIVVCGWGNDKAVRGRGADVIALIREAGLTPRALKRNKDGSPQHPLYVPYDLAPQPIEEVATT